MDRVEGDWKIATSMGMNLSPLCVIPECICHMEETWCRVRRPAHVLWKEEEQVKKGIYSKRDDQSRVRVGTGNSRKPHICQLTSASLGELTRLVIITHSFKEYFSISAFTTTILFSYFGLCLLLDAGAAPCPGEMYGVEGEIDTD